MAIPYKKSIIIGTEKTIRPSSYGDSSIQGTFVVSAYGCSSTSAKPEEYFVESHTTINPQNGGSTYGDDIFENTTDFKPDSLYNDISRFSLTESSTGEFSNTFSKHGLTGSEFSVAVAAYVFKQGGHNPWVLVQPDEKNLIEFCQKREWSFAVLSNKKDRIPLDVQEIKRKFNFGEG